MITFWKSIYWNIWLGATHRAGSPIDTSDHCFGSPVIEVEHRVPDISFTRNVFLKSRADWGDIHGNLSHWTNPPHKGRIKLLIALVNILHLLLRKGFHQEHYICLKDTSWFDDDCRLPYHLKHEAYNLWHQNQEIYCVKLSH